MRKLAIEFVKEVNRNIGDSAGSKKTGKEVKVNTLEEQINCFHERDGARAFLEELDLVSLEYICFHKNWRDVGQVS